MSLRVRSGRLGATAAKPRRLAVVFATAILALAVAGCGQQREGPNATTGALAVARRLAAPEPSWSERLARGGSDWQRGAASLEAAGFDAPAALAMPEARVWARLGPRADGAWWVGASDSVAERVTVRFEGARGVPAEFDAGVVVYRDALASTDVLVTSDAARVEVFYLLRDALAPRRWRWNVALPPGFAARITAEGALELGEGSLVRLRVPAPRARDAEGRAVPVAMRWEADGLSLDLGGLELSGEDVAFPVLVDPVIEVVDWVLRDPGGLVPGRYGHALVYDSARSRLVLFGGYGGGLLGDTWEWDGAAWTQRTPAASPPARQVHALAYDSARSRVVLFGGEVGVSPVGDTWEWDGAAWMQRTPAASPPARYLHALAYDSAGSRVVLFGGYNGASFLGDTWEWDGAAWTQRSPAASPPARYSHALAYDGARSRVVLFGGVGGTSLGDTWEMVVARALGSDCTSASQCGSGFCVDGVCCDSACGGGAPSDCQACSLAAAGTSEGTCTALSAPVASTVTCRASADACDLQEICSSASASCPRTASPPQAPSAAPRRARATWPRRARGWTPPAQPTASCPRARPAEPRRTCVMRPRRVTACPRRARPTASCPRARPAAPRPARATWPRRARGWTPRARPMPSRPLAVRATMVTAALRPTSATRGCVGVRRWRLAPTPGRRQAVTAARRRRRRAAGADSPVERSRAPTAGWFCWPLPLLPSCGCAGAVEPAQDDAATDPVLPHDRFRTSRRFRRRARCSRASTPRRARPCRRRLTPGRRRPPPSRRRHRAPARHRKRSRA